jgi:phosphatidyl-myo-inositol dimannoside synthase
MILVTTQCFPPDRGGIENLVGGLADALNARGKDVVVFADRARASDADFQAPYPVRRFGGFKPLRRWLKARAVAAAARSAGVEGVFADSWKSVELLGPLRAPIAVFAHGMEFPANPTEGKRARITRSLAKAQTIIADSAYSATLAAPYLADGDARVRVLNPPVGPQPEPAPEAMNGVRATIGDRGPVLLTLARLEPRKGVDMVIRAMPGILRAHPKALYVVAGGGGDRARLEQIASETGVAASVHFAGAVDNAVKAALFATADMFVMPTRREGNSVEGFGIVYLEAGWYGLPAIAGRDGGAVDAVQDGKTGLLCDATDYRDVERQILRIFGDEALKHRLRDAAFNHVRGEAQWSRAIDHFLTTLR